MKAMISILLLCVASHESGSQTVYALQPGTKGNQFELTVANESLTAIAEQVEVRAGKHPSAIVFTSMPKQIAAIASSKRQLRSHSTLAGLPFYFYWEKKMKQAES